MPGDSKPTNQKLATRDKILDAAESLFVEKGFAAASLRAIASSAQVNLAATHYHFGSKEGLFAAAIHRCVGPVNDARLAALDKLEASQQVLSVEMVLVAFFTPLVDGQLITSKPRLMGRLYAEPESLTRPVLQEEFSEVMQRFVAAFARLLPGVSYEELRWRFHFLIGAQNQLLNFARPLGMENIPETRKQTFEKLLSFVAAGLKQSQQEDTSL